jgi:hypothetical protein
VKLKLLFSVQEMLILLRLHHKFSNVKPKCPTSRCIFIMLLHLNQLVRFLAENFSKHSRRAALFLPAVVRWQLLWQRAAAMLLTLPLKLH